LSVVFVDSSAFYAVLDRDDANHGSAVRAWESLLPQWRLATTNYVLLEASALLQSRLGLAAMRTFTTEIVPLLEVEWVDEARHRSAV
jgi:uncharacterized protein